jgi:hypothetical protein
MPWLRHADDPVLPEGVRVGSRAFVGKLGMEERTTCPPVMVETHYLVLHTTSEQAHLSESELIGLMERHGRPKIIIA